MKFLFLLLLLLFLIFAFGFSIIRFIFRVLSGGSKNTGQQSSRTKQNKTNYTGKKHNSPKVISKDEGEYIDFEEIK